MSSDRIRLGEAVDAGGSATRTARPVRQHATFGKWLRLPGPRVPRPAVRRGTPLRTNPHTDSLSCRSQGRALCRHQPAKKQRDATHDRSGPQHVLNGLLRSDRRGRLRPSMFLPNAGRVHADWMTVPGRWNLSLPETDGGHGTPLCRPRREAAPGQTPETGSPVGASAVSSTRAKGVPSGAAPVNATSGGLVTPPATGCVKRGHASRLSSNLL